MPSVLKLVEEKQLKFLKEHPDADRRRLGQFFTSSIVSEYMASMVTAAPPADVVRIIDAGAGFGILTVSAVLRCLKLKQKKIHAVLYEKDAKIIPYLTDAMSELAEYVTRKKRHFTFEVRNKDFILSRPDKKDEKYHISLINPPYFKINVEFSPYSGSTKDLYKGDPNIYASFMAVVSSCLVPSGQMVAIVPRSFANGLYFSGFRTFMVDNTSLEVIHIFGARNEVFKHAEVLQEHLICKFVRRKQTARIEVRASGSSEDMDKAKIIRCQSSLLINGQKDIHIIRIPESREDKKILETVLSWSKSFDEMGYFISTGPIVDFRSGKYLTKDMDNSVPLLRMHNIKPFATEWTGNHRKDIRFRLIPGHEKHTSENSVYVLLKRFSAKDERRRLVAAVHDPTIMKGNIIGIENHLNYIGRKKGQMKLQEAMGLAGLFNSTFMDKYFRCISGNTQVNATEIRLIKLPERRTILKIGKDIMKEKNRDQETIDSIVNPLLKTKKA